MRVAERIVDLIVLCSCAFQSPCSNGPFPLVIPIVVAPPPQPPRSYPCASPLLGSSTTPRGRLGIVADLFAAASATQQRPASSSPLIPHHTPQFPSSQCLTMGHDSLTHPRSPHYTGLRVFTNVEDASGMVTPEPQHPDTDAESMMSGPITPAPQQHRTPHQDMLLAPPVSTVEHELPHGPVGECDLSQMQMQLSLHDR